MHNFKKQKVITKAIQKESVNDENRISNFKVSFQYLDTTQKYGSGFKDWQKIGLLSQAMDVLQGFCCSPLRSQVDGNKFAIYDSFPSPTKQSLNTPRMYRKMPYGPEYTCDHRARGYADIGYHYYITREALFTGVVLSTRRGCMPGVKKDCPCFEVNGPVEG